MSNSNVDINEVLRQLRAGGNMPEELVEIFNEEAEEHMRTIYDGLDRLRVNSSDAAALGDVRRSSHTLKGAAGAVGFDAVTRLSHRMEDVFDILADTQKGPTEDQLMLFLATADQIQELTTSEVDFDEAAKTLVDIYSQYDVVMEGLQGGVPAEASAETEEVAETADSVEAEVEDSTEFEIPEIDLAEVLEELQSSTDIDPELAEIFEEESAEHIALLTDCVATLQKDNGDVESITTMRSSAHTLKGAAGAVGFKGISRLSKRVENLLDLLTENSQTPNAEQVELLTTATEKLILLSGEYEVTETAVELAEVYTQFEIEIAPLEAAQNEVEAEDTEDEVVVEEAPQVEEPVAEVESTEAPEQADEKSKAVAKPKSSQQQQYLRVPLDRLDSLVALVGEMIVNRSAFSQRLTDFDARLDEMTTALNRLQRVAFDVETQYSVKALKSTSLMGRRGVGNGNRIGGMLSGPVEGESELDSLEFDRYTEFHLLARSLSEATGDINMISNELKAVHGDLDSLLNRQQRYNRDAQSGLMKIRMVPFSNIGTRLERTVRTVSNKLGKKVDLKMVGDFTELDKTVLEEITDPLLHLIRNALDHGLETPQQRAQAGKPERCQLRVEALNQGTQVTLRVVDDGRGIDAKKVHKKAIERGLIGADEKLDAEEIYRLIFLPGFSTAESLTDVSGRGVGMDVVRDAVQRLKGAIHVDSEPGVGSTFTIHLPTSLAVARALLVESSGHHFAIPMQSVQQIVKLDPNQVTQFEDQPLLALADRTLALKDLAGHLQMRGEKETFDSPKPMLIIRTGDDEVAITVDSVNGGQDIVVKTLGEHLRNVPGYIGATVSGDGTVIPILDPADICGQKATLVDYDMGLSEAVVNPSRPTAMVIDDSLSVRRVTTNLLRSHGWDVIDAKDGVDALEKLAATDTPPDVFLCDMEMPRMDGLELVSRVREQREFEHTPIIMVTSRAAEKHRRMGREAGADEHVVKPFSDDALIGLIDRLVAEHRELVGV